MSNFDSLMKGFGVVTVMNACIFTPTTSYTGAKNCKTAGGVGTYGLSEDDFEPAYEYIDTLKIANFTQEGPTKTITGGQYANPLIKYGKTMTCEMQDALGRASTMVRFFGCEYDGSEVKPGASLSEQIIGNGGTVYYVMPGKFTESAISELTWTLEDANSEITITSQELDTTESETKGYVKITLSGALTEGDIAKVIAKNETGTGIAKAGTRLSVTDKFPGAFAIEGDTFFINQKTGEKEHVFIFIPQFLPDAILTLTQDAEGDATVFDLNGSINMTDIKDETGSRSIFYEIRKESFFKNLRASMQI